jgi:hypothetical protein
MTTIGVPRALAGAALDRLWRRDLHTDHKSRAAAERALQSLRVLLAPLKHIWTHAQLNDDAERSEWAERSIGNARADIERLERDLRESSSP